MKRATSNLACSCSLPGPSGCGPMPGELPEIWGFPFNISATAEASDLKFGTQLGLTEAYHKKSHPEEKAGWFWASGAPQNFEFPYNISATAGASDFKFGAQLGFAKVHHKITPRRKSGRGLWLGKHSYIWGSPLIFLQ